MRKFMIEDRSKGETVAEGTINEQGIVSWTSVSSAVRKEIDALKAQIEQDLFKGHSGGRLRHPLEWMELLSRTPDT